VIRRSLTCLAFGILFGFAFAAGGFNQYDVIHDMLLLRNAAPYLAMGSAVATALPLLWLAERRGWHTPLGGALHLRRVPVRREHVLGGLVFGAGWAVTGACPGTASTTIGGGSVMGIVLAAGMVAGIALRDLAVARSTVGSLAPDPVPDAAVP
jgi:uncharacterized membrane protein YedE/YeeE